MHLYIKNSNCLDCFSGSGGLSIEAISKNANFVTSLEINKKIVTNFKKNLIRLGILNISIIHTNTIKWLYQKGTKHYEIVFIDPPFRFPNLINKTIFLLEKKQWLKKNAFIYIEENKQNNTLIIPKNWTLYKQKTSGQVRYSLYFRNKKPKNKYITL